MKVLVAGAGIGGLALALSLEAAGIEQVELFESAPAMSELGVGINVLPHAVRELIELGLGQELAASGVAITEFVLYNKHGQRVWTEPRGVAAGYRWPQYSIHRGRLLGLLHRAFEGRLGATRLSTGCRVKGFRADEKVAVEFSDGTTVVGDVVVGADGVHSVVRRQLYPTEGGPLWNGITMWRGVAWASPFLSGSSMVIVGHFGKRAVVYPISGPRDDGRVLTNIVLEATTAEGRPMPPEDWNHEASPNEVAELFGSIRYDWLDLGELIQGVDQWLQYPMVDRDPLRRWTVGPVTLLGDAAHPMYPVGANGASQAIIDARVLARCLAMNGDLDVALDAYDRDRRPRTAQVVLANRDVGAEKCLELAEQRAPEGFHDVEEVFAPGELAELSARYKHAAGFDPDELNNRPSFSVAATKSS